MKNRIPKATCHLVISSQIRRHRCIPEAQGLSGQSKARRAEESLQTNRWWRGKQGCCKLTYQLSSCFRSVELFFSFWDGGAEFWASRMLDKDSTAEPHPQPIHRVPSLFLLPHLRASVNGKESQEDLIYKLAPWPGQITHLLRPRSFCSCFIFCFWDRLFLYSPSEARTGCAILANLDLLPPPLRDEVYVHATMPSFGCSLPWE